MRGPLVPVSVLPRFTSYVGAGSYATAPLDVQAFGEGMVTFWRGPLVGGAASDPFATCFEESHDAQVWSEVIGPVTTANASQSYALAFTKRWFRVRVELAADANGVVAISLWMAGVLERRVD